MTNTASTFISSIKNVKSYWWSMAALLVGSYLYITMAMGTEDLKAQAAAAGNHPSIFLLAEAGSNFGVRLESLGMILVASLYASRWTWLPTIVNAGLAYVASTAGLTPHMYVAASLALICLVITWMAAAKDAADRRPASVVA